MESRLESWLAVTAGLSLSLGGDGCVQAEVCQVSNVVRSLARVQDFNPDSTSTRHKLPLFCNPSSSVEEAVRQRAACFNSCVCVCGTASKAFKAE